MGQGLAEGQSSEKQMFCTDFRHRGQGMTQCAKPLVLSKRFLTAMLGNEIDDPVVGIAWVGGGKVNGHRPFALFAVTGGVTDLVIDCTCSTDAIRCSRVAAGRQCGVVTTRIERSA